MPACYPAKTEPTDLNGQKGYVTINKEVFNSKQFRIFGANPVLALKMNCGDQQYNRLRISAIMDEHGNSGFAAICLCSTPKS